VNALLPAIPSQLKKSVGLIHASGTKHFFDKRVYHVLLRNAYERLLEDEVHFIDLATLKAALQFNSNNTQAIKDSLNRLKTVSIEFDVLNQLKSYLYKKKSDLHLGDWHSMTLLAEASIDNSIISYEFSSTMRRLLYEPEMYSVIDISFSKQFTSGYAYSLYEIGLRIVNIGSTGWITVDDFRSIMDVPETVYLRYRDFRRKVIQVAENEVNALFEQGISTIQVAVHEKRTQRKVSHINVEVNRISERLQQDKPIIKLPTLSEDQKKYRDILNKKYKLHIKQAALLVEQFDIQKIESVLNKVEQAKKSSGFNHRKLAGFVYAAIKGRISGFDENNLTPSGESSTTVAEPSGPITSTASGPSQIQIMCQTYFDALSDLEKQALVEEILGSQSCRIESMVELNVSGFSGAGALHVIKHLAKEPFVQRVRVFWQDTQQSALD